MKCERCGYDDKGTSDFAHFCISRDDIITELRAQISDLQAKLEIAEGKFNAINADFDAMEARTEAAEKDAKENRIMAQFMIEAVLAYSAAMQQDSAVNGNKTTS